MAKTQKGKQKKAAPAHNDLLQPHQVILRPLVTEKGLYFAESKNQYSFEVNRLATKTDIKRSVELLYEVKVEKVMTQFRNGKPRRYRFRAGRTQAYKKAIVKLAPDNRIDFF